MSIEKKTSCFCGSTPMSVPAFSARALANALAPFIGGTEAVKPLNTRFVAKAWDNIPQPPSDYYFTDIQLAIDSITDASSTNQYTVLIFPGMHAGAALLSDEKKLELRQRMSIAMLKRKKLENRAKSGRKNGSIGAITDFSDLSPEALTTITLKPNVSLCGFGIASSTVINANLTFTPTALVDTVGLSNLTFIDSNFAYTNLSPLTAGGNFVFNECLFFGGSMNTISHRMMDSISFLGGFIGFATMNFGPAGVHNIDHSSVLFAGVCNFTGDTILGLFPLVRFHSPGTLIEDGIVLTQGATLVLTGAFLQALGSGIHLDCSSFIYSSFSHINAASFDASNNSKLFLSNTPMSIFPATSGCDRTLCNAKMINVPGGTSQPITFASLGLPNYVTNSYQVILNFQIDPADIATLLFPVFVQVDDGSTTTSGFNLSTNAGFAALTFTFVQDNITMMDPD